MSGETGQQFATQAELQELAAQMATQADLKDQDLKLQGQILKLQGLMLDLNPGTPAPAPTRRLSGFRNAMDRHTLVACVWGAVVGAVGGGGGTHDSQARRDCGLVAGGRAALLRLVCDPAPSFLSPHNLSRAQASQVYKGVLPDLRDAGRPSPPGRLRAGRQLC